MATFPYDLTEPIGRKATLGLVALQADETIEHDFRRLLPVEGVGLYVTRVPSGLHVTAETLQAMSQSLPAAVRLLPPSLDYDVVAYGCTSGASVIGPEKVAELVQAATKARAVTEPVSSLVAACAALGVSRLALLSPYVEEVSETLRAALQARGIATPVFGSFNESEDAKVARLAPQSIVEAAVRLGGSAESEAIFLSCTNLRTLDAIQHIEARLGRPVLSSNQVLAWHMGRLAGLVDFSERPGRLLSDNPA